MADCLTPAEMQALLADDLSVVDNERVETHLAECESCRKQVDALRAEGRLFGDIKQAYQAETVAKDAQPVAILPNQPASDSIEGYEILREIHRGGQGVVYKAVQKATKRTIALKVLLQGPYASAKQRHRFEREIDLVASLQHPNIVTIYDSGITKDQRHFFAMEYIHGQPLDVYLSDKNLSIDDTLRLFRQICAAVNHAHQRGVIHRDLKPNNILIDADGEPHVLDFGLAKAAGANLAEGIPVTVTGEFMGTLAYASPEQTKGDPNLIDIRTDVYSLGVILYEMLTNKYPYEIAGQMADVLKNIADTEPKKPSTIRRQINDEVETIVLKALAKEKQRRYQSAETLGRDVERYLSGDPIDAKHDSAWYVMNKMLRRCWLPTVITVTYVILITAFAATWFFQLEAKKDAKAGRTEMIYIQELAATYLLEGHYDAAERLLWHVYAFHENTERKGPPSFDSTLVYLGYVLVKKERFHEAEPLLRECLAIRRERLSEDNWRIGATLSTLGAALSGQGRYLDAEPLLLHGSNLVIGARRAPIWLKRQTLEWIVQLYGRLGARDRATEYRERLQDID